MANKIVFQGLKNHNHLHYLLKILGLERAKRILVSVAFMNKAGISQVSNKIKEISCDVSLLAGIRNGVTSAQGLQTAIDLGCNVYAVDTGARNIIFHPKIYFSRNEEKALLMVGSANLTVGGLRSNIESSVYMGLDLKNNADATLVDDLENTIDRMISDHPENVIRVQDENTIKELIDSLRVADESVETISTVSGVSRNREMDTVPCMKLNTFPVKRNRIPHVAKKKAPVSPIISGKPTPPQVQNLLLVWQSSPLTRRDLNIPTGKNTNKTGSMLLTKGTLDEIDQRRYFRDKVFSTVSWNFDPARNRGHFERAKVDFCFIIKGVNYGIFTLNLSHNTKKDTPSYKQKNSMTSLHWRDAVQLVALEDLLDRTMRLYKNNNALNTFIIEID